MSNEHLLITDSGLGGLSICAAIEKRLRESRKPSRQNNLDSQAQHRHKGPQQKQLNCKVNFDVAPNLRLTYANVWPFEGKGYNDLPAISERAEVFDRALSRLAMLSPDRILIACNTLSILYSHTAFSRATTIPVQGIIEAGVGLFAEAMAAHPASPLVLLGTRTTIESGVHRDALLGEGFPPHRILGIPCHGLAGAIEQDSGSQRVTELIEECASVTQSATLDGSPILVGFCCTHYAYAGDRIRTALEHALSRPIRILDPNTRMALALTPGEGHGEGGHGASIQILSKVVLGEGSRRGIARLIEPVSPATALALLNYHHVPDLF